MLIEINEVEKWTDRLKSLSETKRSQFESMRKFGLTSVEALIAINEAEDLVDRIVSDKYSLNEAIEQKVAPEEKPVEFSQRSDVRQAASAAYFNQLMKDGKR